MKRRNEQKNNISIRKFSTFSAGQLRIECSCQYGKFKQKLLFLCNTLRMILLDAENVSKAFNINGRYFFSFFQDIYFIIKGLLNQAM